MKDHTVHYQADRQLEYQSLQGRPDTKQIYENLRQRAPFLRRLIRDWFPEDRNIQILDLGCGYGAFLYFLKEAGYRNLKGIDDSKERVAVAKGLGLECVEEDNILEILQKSEHRSIDAIIAFDVLEHFQKQELFTIGQEVCRVLRTGGIFLIHVPNGEAVFSGRSYFGDLTHETCFTRQSIYQLMSAVGLTQLYFVEDAPVIHGFKSGVRFVLWKTFRTLFRLIYMAETGDTGRGLMLTQNLTAIAQK